MADTKINTEIISSAKAFGQSINRTAFIIATNEAEDDVSRLKEYKNLDKKDEKRKSKKRELETRYKARILTEIESRILSATSHLQLLHQVCVTVARMTGRDIAAEADLFMEAVAQSDNEVITLQQAQHLITAFMRLRSSKKNNNEDSSAIASEKPASSLATYGRSEEDF